MITLALEKALAAVIAALSLCASTWGFFSWLRANERRRLEADRQLAHALNNFAQLSQAMALLQENMQEMTVELAQIKTLLSLGLNVPTEKPRIRR